MTASKVKAPGDVKADDAAALEPTQAEIDAWVARERERRQAWLKGPSAEERDAYARGLHQRRLAEAFDEGEARIAEGVRTGVRYGTRGAARDRGCDQRPHALVSADLR